jgi:molybdenum cofactor cytidylyltransferase
MTNTSHVAQAWNPKRFRYGVILLAAGASSRMGRPKLLLPWDQTTILGSQLDRWNQLNAGQIAVVCAATHLSLLAELERLGFPESNRIINPQPERGMFSSIRCAAAWTHWDPGLTHWIISLGDQPHVRSSTLQQLIDQAAAEPDRIWQPAFAGHARHPILVNKQCFRELARTEADTLKAFLQARSREVKLCACEDPGLEIDIDSPADYEKALPLQSQQPACKTDQPEATQP